MDTRLTRMVFATAALAAVAAVLAGPAVAAAGHQVSNRTASQIRDAHDARITQAPHVQRHLAPSKRTSRGQSGDSVGRVVAPEPVGLTGDMPSTRVPGAAAAAEAVSHGSDVDWTSFGAGAGVTALLGAGLAAILLAARRRHTVGMP